VEATGAGRVRARAGGRTVAIIYTPRDLPVHAGQLPGTRLSVGICFAIKWSRVVETQHADDWLSVCFIDSLDKKRLDAFHVYTNCLFGIS